MVTLYKNRQSDASQKIIIRKNLKFPMEIAKGPSNHAGKKLLERVFVGSLPQGMVHFPAHDFLGASLLTTLPVKDERWFNLAQRE